MNNASHEAISRTIRVLSYLLLLLVLTVIAVRLTSSNRAEPKYRGHRLMEWVQQLGTPGADQHQAQAAVRAIGPKAVPFLLENVRRLGWQQNKMAVWNKLPAQMQDFVPAPDSDYDLRLNKVPLALSLLGSSALPHLMAASQDHNSDVQFVAVRTIGIMGPAAQSALPTLIQLLHQTNNYIRAAAALAIGQMGPVRTQAIAALVTALPSTEVQAAQTLGTIGAEAKAAVPALTTLLDSPKEYVRVQAATALWKITQKTNLVGWIIEELEGRKRFVNYENYKGYLNLFGEMGPAAKPAVPTILKSMNNWGTDVSRPVRPVLLKIDPEAAAALNKSGK